MTIHIKTIILILATTHVFSAGFDCNKASTNTEKAICENPEISVLDSRLSKYYSTIQKNLTPEEKKELINSQREWLKKRNADCKANIECLKEKYETRLVTLQKNYEKRVFVFPSDDEIRQICTKKAEHPEFLKNKWIKSDSFDINNDGFDEKITSRYAGTMQNPNVEYTLHDGTEIPWTDQVNFEWKDYWNKYISFFQFNGRVYISNDDTDGPAHISIITPENKEYSLCSFDNQAIKKLIPNSTIENSQEICQAVQDKDLEKIEYVDFNLTPLMSISEFEAIREIWRDGMKKQAFVDYDNDGTENMLLEILYSNSSIGLDFNYFDELSETQKEFLKTKRRDLLQKMQGRGVRRPSTSYSNGFFIFAADGKTYYEYITQDDHQVSIMEGDDIKVICTQKTIVTTKVK